MTSVERKIAWVLLFVGILELLALPAVFIPFSWMAAIHGKLGLGEMPDEPIVAYLARSLSAYYAAHGALTVFISFDVKRYLPLIRLWALVFVAIGVVFLVIDFTSGLPLWWIVSEGTFEIVFGIIILFLLRVHSRADRHQMAGRSN
jgi:hypothetical protein